MSNTPNSTKSDKEKTPINRSNLVGDESNGVAHLLSQMSFEPPTSIFPINSSNYYPHDFSDENDDDFENLDLNFDDLYVEGDEEEYFVQQSPLVMQFERAQRPSDRPASSPSSHPAASYSVASGRNLDNTDDNVDDNEYYKMISTTPNDDNDNNSLSKKWNTDTSNMTLRTASSMTTDDDYSVCGEIDTYILGTLIVRVVAARGLSDNVIDSGTSSRSNRQKKRGASNNGGSESSRLNPYATIRFNTLCVFPKGEGQHRTKQLNHHQVQRTSTIFSSCNPVWPRGESMYMDVSHPMPLSASHRGSSKNDGEETRQNVAPISSSAVSSSSTSSTKQLADPGDPPLKAATITAKKSAQAAAMERIKLENRDNTKDMEFLPVTKCILSPIVSCAIFHAPTSDSHCNPKTMKKSSLSDSDDDDRGISKKKKESKGVHDGDSDDLFLGMATLDVTTLLTGKVAVVDEWLTLSGDFPSSSSNRQQRAPPSLRIVCEYEPTDSVPEKGDYVQFTQFCHPSDLYPLFSSCVGRKMFKVNAVYESIHNDNDTCVEISTAISKEGWVSTFVAHRNMLLLCREREPSVVEFCQDELITHVERMSHSPLVETIQETIKVRLPNDGLISVGGLFFKSAISTIFDRWLQNEDTIKIVVEDLKFVTNWDGSHNPSEGMSSEAIISDGNDGNANIISGSSMERPLMNILEDDLGSAADSLGSLQKQTIALPNMPPCPITGVPIRDPVVAADGHTYERAAITRWLLNNNTSPLTGVQLAHKDLVPNYMLLSSLQEIASSKHEAVERFDVNTEKASVTSGSKSSHDVWTHNVDVAITEDSVAISQDSTQRQKPVSSMDANSLSDDIRNQQNLVSEQETSFIDIRNEPDDKTTIDVNIDD